MSATTTSIRERRHCLHVSRLDLSIRSGVSTSWIQELEAGQEPRGKAMTAVLAALDELEAETFEPNEAA